MVYGEIVRDGFCYLSIFIRKLFHTRQNCSTVQKTKIDHIYNDETCKEFLIFRTNNILGI